MKITLSDETATRVQIITLMSCLPDDLRRSVESAWNECADPQWDGTACQTIEHATWRDALKVALRLGFYLGKPQIAPCPDGSVHIYWRNLLGPRFLVETRDGRMVWTSNLGPTVNSSGEAADLSELTRIALRHKEKLP